MLNFSICWCFWVLHFILLNYLFSVITRVLYFYNVFWVSNRGILCIYRIFQISRIVGSLFFLLVFLSTFVFVIIMSSIYFSLNFLIGAEKVTEFYIIHFMQILFWTVNLVGSFYCTNCLELSRWQSFHLPNKNCVVSTFLHMYSLWSVLDAMRLTPKNTSKIFSILFSQLHASSIVFLNWG